jgi:hypothetical protein
MIQTFCIFSYPLPFFLDEKGQKITAVNILSAAASTHFVQFSELTPSGGSDS